MRAAFLGEAPAEVERRGLRGRVRRGVRAGDDRVLGGDEHDRAAAALLEQHAEDLARCLAEEGGPHGIRVNTVNPDAVIQGSSIWSSDWKAERASTYGVSEDELQTFYQGRTKLGVAVLPEDVAEAIAFFLGPRSAKSTGNIINVDGGVTAAYPR